MWKKKDGECEIIYWSVYLKIADRRWRALVVFERPWISSYNRRVRRQILLLCDFFRKKHVLVPHTAPFNGHRKRLRHL